MVKGAGTTATPKATGSLASAKQSGNTWAKVVATSKAQPKATPSPSPSAPVTTEKGVADSATPERGAGSTEPQSNSATPTPGTGSQAPGEGAQQGAENIETQKKKQSDHPTPEADAGGTSGPNNQAATLDQGAGPTQASDHSKTSDGSVPNYWPDWWGTDAKTAELSWGNWQQDQAIQTEDVANTTPGPWANEPPPAQAAGAVHERPTVFATKSEPQSSPAGIICNICNHFVRGGAWALRQHQLSSSKCLCASGSFPTAREPCPRCGKMVASQDSWAMHQHSSYCGRGRRSQSQSATARPSGADNHPGWDNRQYNEPRPPTRWNRSEHTPLRQNNDSSERWNDATWHGGQWTWTEGHATTQQWRRDPREEQYGVWEVESSATTQGWRREPENSWSGWHWANNSDWTNWR